MNKHQLKEHATADLAYQETTKSKVIAVKITTYMGEDKVKQYYSYKSKFENPIDLFEDFPLSLGSNQAIEEIDQFD